MENKRGDGKILMRLFIECLNKSFVKDGKEANLIKSADFENYKIIRESPALTKYRIDVLIQDKYSNSVIIIENKINNAPDTENQIPNYYNHLKLKEKLKVRAIVYLPLTKYKTPNKESWTESNENIINEINNLLIILPVYNSGEHSLIKSWLDIAINKLEINKSDSFFILKHYKEILIIMSRKEEELKSSKDFLAYLEKNKNYENFKKAIAVYNRLPEYQAKKCSEIKEFGTYYQNHSPFNTSNFGEWAFKCENPKQDKWIIPEVIRFSFTKEKNIIQIWADKSGTKKIVGDSKISLFMKNFKESSEFTINKDETGYSKIFDSPKRGSKIVDFIECKLLPHLASYSKENKSKN